MPTYSIRKVVRMSKFNKLSANKPKSVSQLKNFDYICNPFPREMQQATLAQSVEQRIRNAQVVSSSLMSGSAKAGSSGWNFPLLLLLPIQPGAKGQVLPPSLVLKPLSGAKVFILHPMRLNYAQAKPMWLRTASSQPFGTPGKSFRNKTNPVP